MWVLRGQQAYGCYKLRVYEPVRQAQRRSRVSRFSGQIFRFSFQFTEITISDHIREVSPWIP